MLGHVGRRQFLMLRWKGWKPGRERRLDGESRGRPLSMNGTKNNAKELDQNIEIDRAVFDDAGARQRAVSCGAWEDGVATSLAVPGSWLASSLCCIVSCYPIAGTAPSCCSIPSWSWFAQCSTSFPSTKRPM